MRYTQRIILSALCMVLLAATSAMAFGEIRYPDRPLNLRKSRSAKAAWVGSLHPGQKVKVAYLKDGWVAVFEPGETRNSESAAVGYSNARYLLPQQTRVEPKPWGEMAYSSRNLNIRNRPNKKGNKIDMLKTGEHVRVDFPDGDWIMVFSPMATIRSKMNAIGFSSAKYFKPATKGSLAAAGLGSKPAPKPESKPAPAPAPAVSQPVEAASGQGQVSASVAPPPAPVANAETAPAKNAPTSWGKMITVRDKVNVRKERTSSSPYIRTLKPGEKVRVDYLKNGWYAVFPENEPLRKEDRAMGYALQSLLEGLPSGAQPVKAQSASAPEPAPKPAPQSVAKAPVGGEKKTMVIDKSRFSGNRPDPTPNKSAHGYQYRLLEKSETKRYGESWITLKIFLSTTKLPGTDALKDFSATLWKEHKRSNKNLAVLVYLPGQDTEDLAYGVIQFSDEKMLELWVRKTTLFGTEFL